MAVGDRRGEASCRLRYGVGRRDGDGVEALGARQLLDQPSAFCRL
jgi:hypothetical protein